MVFHMAVSRICHYVDNVAYLYLTKIVDINLLGIPDDKMGISIHKIVV